MTIEAGAQLTWKMLWQQPKHRYRFIITMIVMVGVIIGFSAFLKWVEQRDGFVINDPLLSRFQPLDISPLIFAVTYLPVIAGLIFASRDPLLFMRVAASYAFLLILRTITLYLVPLDPPADIIPLRDPVLELTAYNGKAILKDLFFSGHTATHFMFFLLIQHKGVKMFFLVCTIIVGSLVLAQHVHYTIDVIAAPFFAWLAVRISSLVSRF